MLKFLVRKVVNVLNNENTKKITVTNTIERWASEYNFAVKKENGSWKVKYNTLNGKGEIISIVDTLYDAEKSPVTFFEAVNSVINFSYHEWTTSGIIWLERSAPFGKVGFRNKNDKMIALLRYKEEGDKYIIDESLTINDAEIENGIGNPFKTWTRIVLLHKNVELKVQYVVLQ